MQYLVHNLLRSEGPQKSSSSTSAPGPFALSPGICALLFRMHPDSTTSPATTVPFRRNTFITFSEPYDTNLVIFR